MTVAQLKACMLEREFHMWEVYAARRMLPTRRMELHLAQVAQAMAGGKLSDWLFERPAEAPAISSMDGAMAIDSIADGVGVRKLGQGRKKKDGS